MIEKTAKPSMASLIAGLASVFKSIPDDTVADLKDVVDMWNEPGGEHKNPTRGEIVTGPAERMSGDGAPKMISEYSTPAPQQGLTQQYQEFQRMLDGWGKSFAADLMARLAREEKAIDGMMSFFSAMQKAPAESAAATASEPGTDTFLGKSKMKLTKAKSALRKADLCDADEIDTRKSHLAEATDLLKAAKRLLSKASEDMEDTAGEEGCEKAMSELRALTKALAKAEEEDKLREEEEEASKARVAKAEEEAKKKIEEAKEAGEKEKKAEKEAAEAAEKAVQDATAKAMEDMRAQIQKALEGNAVLQSNMNAVLDTIMGKSQNPAGAPEIAKGQVVQGIDFAQRVDQAIDDGRLSEDGINRAMSIVQHLQMVKGGRLDQRIVDAEIEKSPAEVRDLFRAAA